MKWISTQYKGVRYREHDSRKHGVKKDRYYAIRYQRDGKRIEEGLGWTSELDPKDKKHWTTEKAAIVLSGLKEAARGLDKGPTRLRERREIEDNRKEAERVEQERIEKEAITFGEIFDERYSPIAKHNKTNGAWGAESSLYKIWLESVIGKLSLEAISPIHLERIKKNMADAGRSPRSASYALSVVRQVYNFAKALDLYEGGCPVSKVKLPTKDNQRQRFLTHEEADRLLAVLKDRSQDVYHMALLSLHCGLRAGETFSLQWADVDLEKGILTLRDTKSGRTRHSVMTGTAKDMLMGRGPGRKDTLVFPTTKVTRIERISKTFNRVVEELGLNEGITDTRYKVVWHSLRHTYASWLVQSGVSLYTVQKMLGHSRINMTERYSHLHQENMQDAVNVLEQSIASAGKEKPGLVVKLAK
jgi:integrase